MNNSRWNSDSVGERSSPVIIAPIAILRALFLVVGVLLARNLIFLYSSRYMGNSVFTWYLGYYFDFNGEHNFPAFFSAIILLIASGLLYLIYRSRSSRHLSWRLRWLILCIIFLFLAIDENLEIHEQLNDVIRPMLVNDLSGFLHWAWVVPYFIAFLVIAAYFMPFVLSLPLFTKILIFIAGFLFVFGAVGLELIEGYGFVTFGLNHIFNRLLYCLEEFLEMTGVVIFIFALLDYMARDDIRLLIKRKNSSETPSSRQPDRRHQPVKPTTADRSPAAKGN